MAKERLVEGNLGASGITFAIIASRFNADVTEPLLNSALAELRRHGVAEDAVTIFRVPGAFEIPLLLEKVLASEKFQSVLCLGAVIRGDTPHFDYVCENALSGIMQLGVSYGRPVANGIITANTEEQALERSKDREGGMGRQAARTAIEMANLLTWFGDDDRAL